MAAPGSQSARFILLEMTKDAWLTWRKHVHFLSRRHKGEEGRRREKAGIWLFVPTVSGSTFWRMNPQRPAFIFVYHRKNKTKLKMGQNPTYQINKESELECLVFGGGEWGDWEILRLPFSLFLNYENHSFCLLPNNDLWDYLSGCLLELCREKN